MIIPMDLLHCALECLLPDLILKGMRLCYLVLTQAYRQTQSLCNYLIARYFQKKKSHQKELINISVFSFYFFEETSLNSGDFILSCTLIEMQKCECLSVLLLFLSKIYFNGKSMLQNVNVLIIYFLITFKVKERKLYLFCPRKNALIHVIYIYKTFCMPGVMLGAVVMIYFIPKLEIKQRS